jgi:flagellar protein FlbD
MILLTRLDRQTMFLNPDHILSVEETPDTVITLFNGNHLLVREHASVILQRIVSFKSKIIRRSGALSMSHAYLRRKRNNQYNRSESEHFVTLTNTDSKRQPMHRQEI